MDPKSLTRTSFCSKEIDNVTDNSMKKYILDNMRVWEKIDFPKHINYKISGEKNWI